MSIAEFIKKYINIIYRHRYDIFFSVLLFIFVCSICFIFTKQQTKTVISNIEAKTFDIRQNIISKNKTARDDIVIVSVDDPSYELLIEKYGDWPIPRNVYAQMIEYIESQHPKYILLDLLFVKSLNRVPGSDRELINTFKKYPNTYTGVIFDDYPFDVRKPPVIEEHIQTKIINQSQTLNIRKYSNSRAITPGLMEATDKIGHINIPRHTDGLMRSIPLILCYPKYNPDDLSEERDEYYLYATLKMAIDYLNKYENAQINEITINEDNTIKLGNRTIPLTKNAEAILNWYGDSGLRDNSSFKYISFWEVLKSLELKNQGKKEPFDNIFKDKIVYIGTNVLSLYDTHTVPTGKYFPGVELHATLLNNILDNNLIHKATLAYNLIICLILALTTIYTVLKIRSVYVSIILFLIINLSYLYFTVVVMEKYNIWVWAVIPVLLSIFLYICSFIVKYLIKSRDYEYTYKLATTDGLTELYNHRYFQEIIRKEISLSEKNQKPFSLILIDIDFFKKFNDTYGHQAGDAVLKHVAKTLKENVRNEDFVCRYGGEEMTIVLNNINNETAYKTAQKICDAVANKKYNLNPDLDVNVTISLGVSTYPDNGKTPSELIEYADKCLYNAKESGRNRVGTIK